MMHDVWLRANRRVLGALLVVPILLAAAGCGLLVGWSGVIGWVTGGLLLVGALGLGLALRAAIGSPRLAYAGGKLLVHLGPGPPRAVPIELVECFFLGSSVAPPNQVESSEAPRTSTVVVRLAEAAADWQRLPVSPWLGKWCDGYITIYGTWCEPLSLAFVEQLNQRLAAAHRQRRAEQEPATDRP